MKTIANKKVLVTGGAGFIGSNLIRALLENGNRVVCLDNFSTGKRENIADLAGNSEYTMLEGDIRDLAICRRACSGVDYVLHQAALGSVPRSVKDPMTSTAVNIDGFVNILFAAVEAGVKRVVYASSSSVYGDSEELPKTEEKTGKPLSPYAITKYVNELYAENFSRLYGIETVGLRYFNVFGPRQNPAGEYAAVIPRFVASLIRHEKPLIHGDGSNSRDFTYIDNVVMANQLAATADAPNAVNTAYNIACGSRTTLNELFETLRDCLAQFDPAIAGINPDHGPVRPGDIPHSLADISRAARLLGYTPAVAPLDGLRRSCRWYWENCR